MTPKQNKELEVAVERMGGTKVLSARVSAGDEQAVKLAVRAVRYAGGDLAEASFALGNTKRSLQRWSVKVQAFGDAIAELRRPGGRPRRVA